MNKNPNYAKNLKPFKRQKRPYSKFEFKKMYYSGMTISEIAKYYKIGRKIIQNDIKFFNVKARKTAIRDQFGAKNKNWKGDNAGYAALHRRLYHSQPKCCEICGTTNEKKRYEWANISGKFNDPSDYKRMCKSCHSRHDKIIRNIINMKKRRG